MLIPKGLPPKRTLVLVTILVVVVVATVYLVYVNFFKQTMGPTSANLLLPEGGALDSSVRLEATQFFDSKFFDSPAFKRLRKYGSVPVQVGTTGRANPFAPAEVLVPSTSRR